MKAIITLEIEYSGDLEFALRELRGMHAEGARDDWFTVLSAARDTTDLYCVDCKFDGTLGEPCNSCAGSYSKFEAIRS